MPVGWLPTVTVGSALPAKGGWTEKIGADWADAGATVPSELVPAAWAEGQRKASARPASAAAASTPLDRLPAARGRQGHTPPGLVSLSSVPRGGPSWPRC